MDNQNKTDVGDLGYVVGGEKPVLVTNETKNFVVDPADEEVRNPTPGSLIEVGTADLEKLIRLARARMNDFEKVVPIVVPDVETAEKIKNLRRSGYSWRALASECYDKLGGVSHATWFPPSNQLMGIALCNRAASLLGENPESDPWQ